MNTAFDPTIFSAYDVRGIYGENLTDEVAYRIGRAAVLYLNVPEIAVGRDMRLSSPQLADALLQGMVDQGVNAVELGMTTTDELYFAVGKFNYPAGVMITASHNPGNYNGMKFCRAQAFPISLDNGMAGMVVPRVFMHLPCELVPLYFELDGSFPNHPANPIEPANTEELRRKV